jgi:hypothetical protein
LSHPHLLDPLPQWYALCTKVLFWPSHFSSWVRCYLSERRWWRGVAICSFRSLGLPPASSSIVPHLLHITRWIDRPRILRWLSGSLNWRLCWGCSFFWLYRNCVCGKISVCIPSDRACLSARSSPLSSPPSHSRHLIQSQWTVNHRDRCHHILHVGLDNPLYSFHSLIFMITLVTFASTSLYQVTFIHQRTVSGRIEFFSFILRFLEILGKNNQQFTRKDWRKYWTGIPCKNNHWNCSQMWNQKDFE